MNDGMVDLMAGDARLRRRLEAYAEARLSPEPAASTLLRARVLAHAHRQSDLMRADASLTVVSAVPPVRGPATRRRGRIERLLLAASAAALALALVGGATVAARAGGLLYDARLWVETATLPSEPSARAVAELARLQERLREADAALAVGDTHAATAALAAYERIMDAASDAVIASDDAVAAAALETGVGRNVDVLLALLGRVPAPAGNAIERAVERAVERSDSAIDRVDKVEKPRPGGGGSPPGAAPTPAPAADPTRTPKPKPTHQREAEPTSKPTKPPTAEPEKTDKPDKPDKTDKPPRPEPRRSPGNDGGNGNG